jgi:hypothetical protein
MQERLVEGSYTLGAAQYASISEGDAVAELAIYLEINSTEHKDF